MCIARPPPLQRSLKEKVYALRLMPAELLRRARASDPSGPWTAQLGIWIVVAFFGVVRFLTYIDQRIRTEGWEVELRLRAAGLALEDTERW